MIATKSSPVCYKALVQSDFTRKGMSALTVDSYGYPVEALTLPFFVLKNDDLFGCLITLMNSNCLQMRNPWVYF